MKPRKTTEGRAASMKKLGHLDPMDRGILRALSLHEHLGTLELWYELMGNENSNEWVTEEKVLRRLKALTNRGLVEPVSQVEGSVGWALRKGKVFDATLLLV